MSNEHIALPHFLYIGNISQYCDAHSWADVILYLKKHDIIMTIELRFLDPTVLGVILSKLGH